MMDINDVKKMMQEQIFLCEHQELMTNEEKHDFWQIINDLIKVGADMHWLFLAIKEREKG